MTKREMFAEIRKVVIDNEEMVAFIDHEVELLNKKSGTPRKPTATQKENEVFKAGILVTLAEADTPVNIRELVERYPALDGLTNQRITHMLTDLVKKGEVVKNYIKKVPYFSLNTEATEA